MGCERGEREVSACEERGGRGGGTHDVDVGDDEVGDVPVAVDEDGEAVEDDDDNTPETRERNESETEVASVSSAGRPPSKNEQEIGSRGGRVYLPEDGPVGGERLELVGEVLSAETVLSLSVSSGLVAEEGDRNCAPGNESRDCWDWKSVVGQFERGERNEEGAEKERNAQGRTGGKVGKPVEDGGGSVGKGHEGEKNPDDREAECSDG